MLVGVPVIVRKIFGIDSQLLIYVDGTSKMITCDQSVASWRAEATPSYDFSTYPGDHGCNLNTIRFLCIMKQRSTQVFFYLNERI
jgi:surfactin synthase thioesterase subunit